MTPQQVDELQLLQHAAELLALAGLEHGRERGLAGALAHAGRGRVASAG